MSIVQIQGVDPVVLTRIQDQTQKPAVQEVQRAQVEPDAEKRRQGKTMEELQERLTASARQLNRAAEAFDVQVRFRIDQEEGDLYVLVIDRSEGKVIRRIPPEKLLATASGMREMVGLILDILI